MSPGPEPPPQRDGDRVEIAGPLYHGIPCRVRIAGDDAAARAAWQALASVDAVFNVWRPDSELGRINAAPPGRHHVSAWLAACLRLAGEVEAASGGAWSAAMLPLVRRWRLAAAEGAAPDDAELVRLAATAACGWSLDGQVLTIHRPDVALDLGGIAKGFAVDRAVEELRARDVADLLVQAGGESACLGAADASGRRHRLAIPHPDQPDDAYCAVLQDPGSGLCGSTSGDYRLAFAVADGRHHHLLDPRSGRPTGSGAASATWIFPGLGRNALADGLSGALAVLGADGLPRLHHHAGGEACLLRRDAAEGLRCTRTAGWAACEADA